MQREMKRTVRYKSQGVDKKTSRDGIRNLWIRCAREAVESETAENALSLEGRGSKLTYDLTHLEDRQVHGDDKAADEHAKHRPGYRILHQWQLAERP